MMPYRRAGYIFKSRGAILLRGFYKKYFVQIRLYAMLCSVQAGKDHAV